MANDSDEEKEDTDSRKTKAIAGVLGKHSVQVIVARVFGLNTKRTKKHFACVLTGQDMISEGLDTLMRDYPDILAELGRNEARGFLDCSDR